MDKNDIGVSKISLDSHDFDHWAPSLAQVRDAVLGRRIMAPNFTTAMDLLPEAADMTPNFAEVEQVGRDSFEAVSTGKVFDFGRLPNTTIQYAGSRGGGLWQRHALQAPFRDTWLMYHTWEWGTGIYLVNMDEDRGEICELQPMSVKGIGLLVIGDRGMFFRNGPDNPDNERYHAAMTPFSPRFHADPAVAASINNGSNPYSAAAGNIGDPVMAGLLILNTRGIARETVRVSDKLQNARRKSGKMPIPPYERILTAPYVTALNGQKSGPRGEAQGGTHRSPVPHIRQGHPRQYASGKSIFVPDTLVAVPPDQRDAFKSARSHYKVQQA